MTITINRLNNVKFLSTPHTSGLLKDYKYIIIHDDEGASMAGTESWIQNPQSKVSYHVLVGKNGEVTQFVDLNKRAYHAGVSEWKGLKDLNWYSIGVSMQNRNKEPYTEKQIEKCIEVCKAISKQYNIKEALGHKDISPKRKTDPHNGFPWSRFRSEVFAPKTKKTTAEFLNLRDNPNGGILATLPKNTEVTVFSTVNGWSEVYVPILYKKGWVSNAYLND